MSTNEFTVSTNAITEFCYCDTNQLEHSILRLKWEEGIQLDIEEQLEDAKCFLNYCRQRDFEEKQYIKEKAIRNNPYI